MTAYIATAAGAVFLTVIVGMIMPEGKLNKPVNFVLRIACIAILISPVFSIFDITISDEESGLVDYGYVSEVFSDSQSDALQDKLAEKFGVQCECRVDIVYEDGAFREKGVTIYPQDVEKELIDDIVAYLKELGYININVHEETA